MIPNNGTIGTGTGFAVGFSQSILQVLLNFGTDNVTALDWVVSNPGSPCNVQVLSGAVTTLTLNATTCPALPTAGGVWIVPAAGQGNISIKGISADTGINLSGAVPTFLPFTVTPPTSFVLTSANQFGDGVILIWV